MLFFLTFLLFIHTSFGFKTKFIKQNFCSSLKFRQADSENGFDFGNQEIRKSFQRLNYGISSRTRELMSIKNNSTNIENTDDEDIEIIEKKDYFPKDPRLIRKSGYPKQSFMNITLPRIDSDDEDIEDELEDELESQLRKMFNVPSGIKIFKIPDPHSSGNNDDFDNDNNDDNDENHLKRFGRTKNKAKKNSLNFEIIENPEYSFNDVGGYDNVKEELMQTIDILKNFEK